MRTGPIKSTTIVALGAAGMCLATAPASAQFAGFGPPTILSAQAADQPQAVVVGDFDGDGDNDLAVAYTGTNNVAIFKNNGDGTFEPQPFTVNVGQGPISIVTGNLDSDIDGDLDLAVANNGSLDATILKNDGLGVFTQFGSPIFLGGTFTPSLAIGDLNNDGKLDLAANTFVAQVQGVITTLLNDGSGSFSVSTVDIDAPKSVTIAD